MVDPMWLGLGLIAGEAIAVYVSKKSSAESLSGLIVCWKIGTDLHLQKTAWRFRLFRRQRRTATSYSLRFSSSAVLL